MKKLALLLILLVASNAVIAGKSHVSACKVIHWQPYQVYTINSSLHQRTHIILPEPIQGVPVPGNPQLWDVDGENIHLFIKPQNFGNNEGGKTTVTAISTSNNSYDFVVNRVKRGADVCVRIVQDNSMALGKKQGWKTQQEREKENLEFQLSALKQQMLIEKQANVAKVDNSLQKYKANIYTGYDWDNSLVSDVWDDGRFTYIRIKNAKKGLLQISSVVDSEPELIDYDYDSATHLYTVSGLFNELALKYDEYEITIEREDDGSFDS